MIIKRVISITIIFCLMLSVCIFAHADIDETIIYEFEEIQPEEISNFTTMLDGGGDNPVTPNVIYNGIKLFEFSAVNVSESVFSDLTNKYF